MLALNVFALAIYVLLKQEPYGTIGDRQAKIGNLSAASYVFFSNAVWLIVSRVLHNIDDTIESTSVPVMQFCSGGGVNPKRSERSTN
jgi:hypothetical protein